MLCLCVYEYRGVGVRSFPWIHNVIYTAGHYYLSFLTYSELVFMPITLLKVLVNFTNALRIAKHNECVSDLT